jgi:hypothetical protein
MVAAVVVFVAAVGGIVAILGWLPEGLSGDTPFSVAPPGLRIAGTAPPESLSAGESIVAPEKAPAAQESAPQAEKKTPPAPRKAEAPLPPAKKACPNCGTVAGLVFRANDAHGAAWEVAVAFDDGTRRTLRYPTNPGFRVGERVVLANGREGVRPLTPP